MNYWAYIGMAVVGLAGVVLTERVAPPEWTHLGLGHHLDSGHQADASTGMSVRVYADDAYLVRVYLMDGIVNAVEYTRKDADGRTQPLHREEVLTILDEYRDGSEWQEMSPADRAFEAPGGPHQSEVVKDALKTTRWVRKDQQAIAEFDRTRERLRIATPTADEELKDE